MKRISSILPIVIFSCFLTALIGCGIGGTPEQRFEKGVAQLERYEYEQADSTFAKLGREIPDRPWGLFGKGVSAYYKRHYIDALYHFLDITTIQSDFHEVLPYLARTYEALEEPGLAARTWLQVQDLDGKNREAIIGRIEDQLRARRPKQAEEALNNLKEQAVLSETARQLLLAQVDWQSGHPDSCLERLKSLKISASDTTALRLQANMLELREYYDSAMIVAHQLLEAQPKSASASFEFLNRAHRIGDYAAARRVIEERVTRDTTTIQAVSAWLPHYWAKSDLYRADKFTTRLYITGGDALSVPFFDIRTRWMFKDRPGAMENVIIFNDRMAKAGVPEEIAKQIRGPLVILYGHIFEPETDMGSLRAAQGWKNDELLYRQREARFFAITDQKEQFEGLIGDFLTIHRLESEWLAAIGQLYLIPSVLDTVKAKGMFEEAIRLDHLERVAFAGLLQIAYAGGVEKGLAVYDAYPQFERHFPSVAMDKAVLLIYLGRFEEAEALFIGRRGPIAAQPRMQKLYLEALSRFAHEDALKRGIDLMVNSTGASAESYAEAAILYLDDKRFTDAAPLVEAGLKLDPQHAKLLAMRARIWYADGKKTESRALFDSLILAADGDADANIYFSQALASDTTEPVLMGNYARQGFLFSQASFRARQNLIEVYLASGDMLAAENEAVEAIKSYPDQPRGLYYYGLIIEKESPKEARIALESALLRGLKAPERQRAEEILARLPK